MTKFKSQIFSLPQTLAYVLYQSYDSCHVGNQEPPAILAKEKRSLLFSHIKANALSKGIHVDTINGHLEHVHCLFELDAEMTLPKTLQLLKGEASHWANAQHMFAQKLDWADEYFAVSVSESVAGKVRAYIDNQEEHHKRITFAQEYEMFLKKCGLWKDKQKNS